jgi:RNA polymerase sigma factor (sigma-70 family)
VTNPKPNSALGQLRKLLAAQRNCRLPDDQLLAGFLADRDESAFAVLVKRHWSMVFDVCQSVLRHSQDAEDASQSAFLVLAQKAGSIRKKTSVASWLHGVAYRLACKLKSSRKRIPEPMTDERTTTDPIDELSWREVRQIVHEELDRLPEKYRQPLILCYLEGQPHEQAARQLGWNAGIFKGMLTRGRDLLRRRLTRRGLGLSAPLIAGILAPRTATAVFARTTAHAAVLIRRCAFGISARQRK